MINTQEDTPITKLHGQVAVITGATAGMALAAATLFVTEGAHVYITGRRKDQLDDAVSEIGGSVTVEGAGPARRHRQGCTVLGQ